MTPIRRERDYILGTDEAELERLGLQHSVWRPTALQCWQEAGITVGSRVLDVGAGPGYATLDLADIVGSNGRVVAVERSERFVEAARDSCRARRMSHVDVHQLDLMEDPMPAGEFDAAWARWVASFVPSPSTLVDKIAGSLRPGGVAIFHEYVNYATWRVAPRNRLVEEFVQHVMESWRESGGEPDVASGLPSLLAAKGFHVRAAEPRVFCVRPEDHVWRWPAAFMEQHIDRLRASGRVDASWAAAAHGALRSVEADPESLMITPMVLEIVASLTS